MVSGGSAGICGRGAVACARAGPTSASASRTMAPQPTVAHVRASSRLEVASGRGGRAKPIAIRPAISGNAAARPRRPASP